MFASMITNIALKYTLSVIIFHQLVNGLAIEKSAPSDNAIQLPPAKPPIAQQERRASDTRRPIWNLAHMVNSIKELDYRLGKGANAVEVDVTFSRDGDPLFTYHGPPCDCWRHCHQQEDFSEYLTYLREIAIDEPYGIGKNLSLLFLDLKLDALSLSSKAQAGRELAKSIVSHLFLDSDASIKTLQEDASIYGPLKIQTPVPKKKLYLIISINHVSDIELVNNFIYFMEQNNSSHLMERIGFDVGMNDDVQQIEIMWKRFGNTLNLWQGDGFTNCFSPFYNLERLSKAISKRDSPTGYPRKVYQWTIDLHDRMREALRMGVDAVMTNHPERLLTVLKEPEMAHNYRLANLDDDPFTRIVIRPSARSSELARHQRSASSTNGGFLASIIDVISSWFAYIKEIPFLSLPTTTRFLSKAYKRQQRPSNATTTTILLMPSTLATQTQSNTLTSPSTNSSISAGGLEHRVDYVTGSSTNDTNLDGSNSTSSSPAETTTSATTTTTNAAGSISDSLEKAVVSGQIEPYEGPKWYTSLVSNMLVSALKVILPTQS